MEDENNRPYKVKDVNRTICKGIVGATLEEVKAKSAERFEKPDLPTIHLDSDGTEIDDEEYFQTLEPNTELVAVFSGEHWIDPTHYVTITAHRSSDTTDSAAANVRRANLQKIVNELRNNLHNVSVLSETDLEMITNMDPESIADIVGKEFLVDQLKDVTDSRMTKERLLTQLSC